MQNTKKKQNHCIPSPSVQPPTGFSKPLKKWIVIRVLWLVHQEADSTGQHACNEKMHLTKWH